MNYRQLQDLVTFWLKRKDVERIAKDAQLLVMEAELPITFTSAFMPLPADFASFKRVSGNRSGRRYPLDLYTKQQLDLITGASNGGSASGYAIYSNGIEIGPFSAEALVESTYFKRPALLELDGDTNDVLSKWPSIYLYAMLTYAANSMQNIELENVYQAQYLAEVDQANAADKFAQMSGNAPRMI